MYKVLVFVLLLSKWGVVMSENTFYAYFVDDQVIQNGFGSKNAKILEQALSDKSNLIEELSGRFSGDKTLADAIKDLVNGVSQEENRQFHYSFALWIIVDALAENKPSKPRILAPGIDLYELNEVLLERKSYGQLLAVFQALNNEIYNTFPYQLSEWADLPGFAYVDQGLMRELGSEIKAFRAEVDAGEDWLLDIEDIEEIEVALSWLEEAIEKEKNLLIVMDGDL